MGDEIQVSDIPVLSAQINPHGFVHEVLTVRKAWNYQTLGPPTPADSWFPGYLWRYALCIQCQNHLGWAYMRPGSDIITFVGLRRRSVVEGQEE